MAIKSIAFTVYPVSNMERARAFYEHVLGLHMTYHYQDEWVEYDLGDGTFAITTTAMGHTPGAKGAVVAFEVSDLDAFVQKMKEQAVVFVTEVIDTPVCRMAVIEDPDRNHVTIHRRNAS
jgi:predicted enzyme related to lactoylglutathione lyase